MFALFQSKGTFPVFIAHYDVIFLLNDLIFPSSFSNLVMLFTSNITSSSVNINNFHYIFSLYSSHNSPSVSEIQKLDVVVKI